MATVLLGAPVKIKWDEGMISRPGKMDNRSHSLYPFLSETQMSAIIKIYQGDIRKVLRAGEACGPLVSLSASTLLLSLEADCRHRCLHFIEVVSGHLRRRDSRRWSSFSPNMQGRWRQEFGSSSPGGRVGNTRYLGGFLKTIPLLKDH